jgi:hypothetical protein
VNIIESLREAIATGRELDLDAGADHGDQLLGRSDWEQLPDRCIPAELIADLLAGQDKDFTRQPKALILRGAHITGQLSFDWIHNQCAIKFRRCLFDEELTARNSRLNVLFIEDCLLPSADITGLSAGWLRITGTCFEGSGATAERGISGLRDTNGTTFNSVHKRALTASGVHIDQEMICRNLKAHGDLYLDGADIGGSLSLSGARLAGADYDDPVNVLADRITVRGSVFFLDKFESTGLISFSGANIIGNLEMDGAQLRSGLLAVGMHVGGSVFFRDGFTSRGPIDLSSCRIRADLDIHNARLLGADRDGISLRADELEAGRIYGSGLRARGMLLLAGARISSDLEMNGAQLSTFNELSVSADRLQVGGTVKFRSGFLAEGAVRLNGAKVAGQLDIGGSSIPFLNLTDASVQTLVDCHEQASREEAERSWPEKLEMSGFEYKWIEPAEVGSARTRLRWLKRQINGYVPHIYSQLASMYSSKGMDADARRVRLANERIRRRAQGKFKTVIGWIPDALVGFGYKPWRAIGWSLLLLIVGTLVFAHEHSAQNLIPIKTGGAAAEFHPALYTLNLLLPVVNLGQSDSWITRGSATWLASGWTIAGWALASVVVAGLTGVFRKS